MPLTISDVAIEAHRIAKEHGWWDDGMPREIGTLLSLIHSEISEALECWRESKAPSDLQASTRSRSASM